MTLQETLTRLRDTEAEKRSKRQCATGQKDLDAAISWYLKIGFEDGFASAQDLLLPLIEKMKLVIEFYGHESNYTKEGIIFEYFRGDCGQDESVQDYGIRAREALSELKKLEEGLGK